MPVTHRDGTPLAPPGAPMAMLSALAVAVLLGRLAWHSQGVPPLDAWVLRELGAHDDGQLRLATEMTARLRQLTVWATVAIAILAWAALRRWQGVLLSLVAPAITLAVVEKLLKPLVARQVPGSPSFNYPSGHVAVVTALALCLVLIVRAATARPAIRALAVLCAGLLVLLMAWARLVETAHFLSDVVGGVATAVAVTLAAALVLDRRRRAGLGR
jgi:membrane-associated phospholipid phosphatase